MAKFEQVIEVENDVFFLFCLSNSFFHEAFIQKKQAKNSIFILV